MDDDLTPLPDLPEFDWSAEIPADTILTIAFFGDREMRLNVAAHRSITDDAGNTLIDLGDKEICAVLRKNIAVSHTVFVRAVKPGKAARIARRVSKRSTKADLLDLSRRRSVVENAAD